MFFNVIIIDTIVIEISITNFKRMIVFYNTNKLKYIHT